MREYSKRFDSVNGKPFSIQRKMLNNWLQYKIQRGTIKWANESGINLNKIRKHWDND